MRHRFRASLLAGAVCVLLLTLPSIPSASAAAGDLDASFSEDGRVLTNLSSASGEAAYDVAVDPKGRIVVVGGDGMGRFAIARYRSHGQLDERFGGDGVVTTEIRAGPAIAEALVMDPNGGILAVGTYWKPTGEGRFVIIRYTRRGDVDADFGPHGKAVARFPVTAEATGAALQDDGAIVVAGMVNSRRFVVVRFRPDGFLDVTFGDGGIVTTNVGVGEEGALDVVILPNGKIVAVGQSHRRFFTLVRYRHDGTLDPTFGEGGIVRTEFGVLNTASTAAVVDDHGRMVAGGYVGFDEWGLARYRRDGTLDTTFDEDGKVQVDVSGLPFDLALQGDGAIVQFGGTDDFDLARFDASGSLDSTFGGGAGWVATGFRGNTLGIAVTIQPDGRIIGVGGTENDENGRGRWVLARYLAA